MTGPISHYFPDWLLSDVTWLYTSNGLLGDVPGSLALIQRACEQLISGAKLLNDEQIGELDVKRTGPLGRYFEALVQTVISASPEVRQCYPNVVIQNGNRTLGELDLVYENVGGGDSGWVHLELAVKFYIGAGDPGDAYQWRGPAARDTLGRKVARLFDHQLKLPHTAAGIAALSALTIKQVHSQALVMGRLFHPHACWLAGDISAPTVVADDHPAGWWLRAGDIKEVLAEPGLQWRTLSKPEWLAPVDAADQNLMDGRDLYEHLWNTGADRPVMVAASTGGAECQRGFIVPDNWPPI